MKRNVVESDDDDDIKAYNKMIHEIDYKILLLKLKS